MICGSQEYILEQKVSEIVDEISRRAPGNFELVKLARGVDEDLYTIFHEAPLFVSLRLILCRVDLGVGSHTGTASSFDFVSRAKEESVRKAELKWLDDVIENSKDISESLYLVVAVYAPVWLYDTVINRISQEWHIIRLNELKGSKQKTWILERAKAAGIKDAQMVAEFLSTFGTNFREIDSELAKIAVLEQVEGKLSLPLLQDVVSLDQEPDIWKAWEATVSGNASLAFNQIQKLIARGMNGLRIANRLSGQIENYLYIGLAIKQGEGVDKIAKELDVKEFYIRKVQERMASSSIESFIKALAVLKDYEWKVKTGQITEDLGIFVAISKLLLLFMAKPVEVELDV